jgi:hypothetical protein
VLSAKLQEDKIAGPGSHDDWIEESISSLRKKTVHTLNGGYRKAVNYAVGIERLGSLMRKIR